MAKRLSSKIRQAAQNLRQSPGPVGGATQRAFEQSQVAQGMAPTGQPLGQSNIAETLAIQNTQGQLDQAAQQLESQADQAQVVEAEQASKEKMFDTQQTSAQLESNAQYSQQLDQQLNKYEQFSLDMSEAEEDLALEKMGFELMLKDKQYMAYLDQSGRMGRLHNELEYKKEVANQIFGERLAETMRQIGFMESQHDLDMKNADALASLSINDALAAASAALEDDLRMQESQAWSSLGSSGAKVIQGLDDKGVFDQEPSSETEIGYSRTGRPSNR